MAEFCSSMNSFECYNCAASWLGIFAIPAQPRLQAFPNDPVLGLPDHFGSGSFGDGVALTFEWHLSVFDRSSDLPQSTKLAAIFVAGCTRFSGTTPPRQ